MRTLSGFLFSLLVVTSIPLLANASSRMVRGYFVAINQDDVEIGFVLKLFGNGSEQNALTVAQGTTEFAYQVEISSPFGEINCVLGKMAPGPGAAQTLIKNKGLVSASSYTFKVGSSDEVACQSNEDRKLQVNYRIQKNLAENVVANEIQKTLEELKSGSLKSEYSRVVLNTVLENNFKNLTLKAGKAEVMVLDQARKAGTPMIGVLITEPMKISGSTMQPSGKNRTEGRKNIYPQLNRFAVTCGYADESDGTIKQPMVPQGGSEPTLWTTTSPGKPFGCIVNNSKDGFDAIDPYVEDPFYTLRYLILPESDFKTGLEKIRLQVAESVDRDRAGKLEKVASQFLELNKKRVQLEMDRRRMEVMRAAGYATEGTVTLEPKSYSFAMTGKPRYSAGLGSHAGELKADTVFDVQGEKVEHEFQWINGTTFSFSEDQAWSGLKAPLVSQDYSTKYSHFIQTYQICAYREQEVKSFLSALEKTPNAYDSSQLLQLLAQKHSSSCASQAGTERRTLNYVRYEGECFVETPYRKNDTGQEMIRYKPTQVNLVYADKLGHAVAKAPLDLAKLGNDKNLFAGLDVLTTLPYDAVRAATYKLKCGKKTEFPKAAFSDAQLGAQGDILGFSSLLGGQSGGLSREQKAAPKPVMDPNAGTIDLRKYH